MKIVSGGTTLDVRDELLEGRELRITIHRPDTELTIWIDRVQLDVLMEHLRRVRDGD